MRLDGKLGLWGHLQSSVDWCSCGCVCMCVVAKEMRKARQESERSAKRVGVPACSTECLRSTCRQRLSCSLPAGCILWCRPKTRAGPVAVFQQTLKHVQKRLALALSNQGAPKENGVPGAFGCPWRTRNRSTSHACAPNARAYCFASRHCAQFRESGSMLAPDRRHHHQCDSESKAAGK